MPSINDAIQAHINLVAAGKGNSAPPASPPSSPPVSVNPAGVGQMGPNRGTYQPGQILDTDFSRANLVGGGPMRSPVFPIPAASPVTKVIQNTTKTTIQSLPGLLLEINGVKNPSQTVLNLVAGTGMQITSDGQGGVNFVSTASGDGLTHGTTPWESDPGYILLRDDFFAASSGANGTLTAQSIGTGWILNGTFANSGMTAGGPIPNLGVVQWENAGTVSNTGCLQPNVYQGPNSVSPEPFWPLLDFPGWVLTWVFKVEAPRNQSNGFSTAQKAIYIGLAGVASENAAGSSISRPDIFFGVRYDTSTSAPSINDSFFTLEAVVNNTFSTIARHNNQGTTKVTSVAPVQGVWHRLDISCSKVGQLTITLDGATSLSVTVAQWSNSIASITNSVVSHQAVIEYSVGAASNPSLPYGGGSQLTISGFTGSSAVLNGTQTIKGSGSSGFILDIVQFDISTPNFTGSSQTATLSIYPALLPTIMYGNDDTAGPTASTMALYVDFFSFIWNPALGAGATPSASKSRYF